MSLFSRNKTVYLRSVESEFNLWTKFFSDNYTKDEMVNVLSQIESMFATYTFLKDDRLVNDKCESVVRNSTRATKKELAEMTATFFSADTFRRTFAEGMEEATRKVWLDAFDNLYLNPEKVNLKYHVKVVDKIRASGYYYHEVFRATPQFSLFKLTEKPYWSDNRQFLLLPQFLRAGFAPLLWPAPAMETVAEPERLPKEKYYNSELNSCLLMPVMQSLLASGKLVRGRVKVTATTLKLLRKSLQFVEFFPDVKDKAISSLAATLCATVYCLFGEDAGYSHRTVAPPAPDVLREMVRYIRNRSENIFPLLCDIVLGKTYQSLLKRDGIDSMVENLFDMLTRYCASDTWMPREGIVNWFKGSVERYEQLYVVRMQGVNEVSLTNSLSENRIMADSVIERVGIPFALTILGILASFGMVEFIYDPTKGDDPHLESPFAAVRFFRLTELGKYAFGIIGSYQSPVFHNGPYFELDSERLLVRALEENNPYEGFLTEYAVGVGGRRYSVTPASFLSGCKVKKDISNKIKSFTELVGADVPPNWKEFFDSMISRQDSITMPQGTYIMVQVSPDDRNLVDLLMSDPELRELSVAAEGYLLLVKTENVDKFSKKMREYGYLL